MEKRGLSPFLNEIGANEIKWMFQDSRTDPIKVKKKEENIAALLLFYSEAQSVSFSLCRYRR